MRWECVYDSRYSNIFAQTRYIVRFTRHPISNVSTLTCTLSYTNFPFFFLYSELVWIVEKRTENKTKAMEEECEREWERERHFNQCIAYNGCDSHKYRLVFLSHGENDEYKRGAGASFFFWHIPYLRMFLLLMNIFFFYFFIIIMLFFLAQAMAIISRHRFYVE